MATGSTRFSVALCLVVAMVCVARPLVALCALNGDPDVSETSGLQMQDDEARKKKKKKTEKKSKEEQETSKLADFETEATDERPDSLQWEESGELSGWWGVFGKIALYAVVGGGVGSWYRVTGSPVDDDLERYWGDRQTGDTGLPFIALGFGYQNVKSDVQAYDTIVEGGYGPVAVRYRFTRFTEDDPDVELDLSWVHGVTRLSYTRYVEVGLGFGAIMLDGSSSESGSSFVLPIRIEPHKNIGLDYQSSWGWINDNTIGDHDLSLRVGVRYVSFRAGYRWTKTGNSTLEGPIFALTASY
jgi:hypothetical protein